MRLFQPQASHSNYGNLPSLLPHFMKDQGEEGDLVLLRESTLLMRDRGKRLPTPKRAAVMGLLSSYDKRRLGKQQQILSDISQRCREQEVAELSSRMTSRVDWKQTTVTDPDRLEWRTFSEHIPSSTLNFDPNYKCFPVRKIMRQKTRVHVFQTGLGGYTSNRKWLPNSSDCMNSVRSSNSEAPVQIFQRHVTCTEPSFQQYHSVRDILVVPAPLHLPRPHDTLGNSATLHLPDPHDTQGNPALLCPPGPHDKQGNLAPLRLPSPHDTVTD